MATTSTYDLVKYWKYVVSHNKLEKAHKFHIWSFKVDNKLYFLLNKTLNSIVCKININVERILLNLNFDTFFICYICFSF